MRPVAFRDRGRMPVGSSGGEGNGRYGTADGYRVNYAIGRVGDTAQHARLGGSKPTECCERASGCRVGANPTDRP